MMKKMALLVALALIAPAFLSLNAMGGDFREKSISSEDKQQLNPSIYRDLIVWEDYRNDPYGGYTGTGTGNPDIYLYNISSDKKIPVCTQKSGDGTRNSAQQNPDIWKNLVVWEDWRNGNADIYIYDLKDPDQPENGTQLTFNAENQQKPRIWGHYVVWIDYRNGLDGDIYAYNLSSDSDGNGIPDWKEKNYGVDEANKAIFPVCDNIFEQRDAAIYGSTVVWKDYRNDIVGNGNRDIYGYNISSGHEFQICTEKHNQFQPAIYGNTVVWVDMRTGTPAIYGKNISTGNEFRVSASDNPQRYPDIWENTVLWLESVGNRDVIKIGSLNGQAKDLIPGDWNQRFPAISSIGVVWSDGRNTEEDQYGRTVVNWNVYFLRTFNSAPIIGDVLLNPKEVPANKETEVRVSVRIYDPEGDNFTAYLSSESTGEIPLYDDGMHRDGAAGDGIYGANFSVKPEKSGEIAVKVVATDEYNASSSADSVLKIEKENNPLYVLIGIFASMLMFIVIMISVYLIRRKTNRELDTKDEAGKKEEK